jgi:hypothetical protein
MVPFWDLSGHINDLTSKKIPLTAPEDLIGKLFGHQPVEKWGLALQSITTGSRRIMAIASTALRAMAG